MLRSLAHTTVMAALTLALAVPAARTAQASPAATDGTTSFGIAELKRLQQRLLMQEALEAAREREGHERERVPAKLQRYRDIEAGVRHARRGTRQRPAPFEPGAPAPTSREAAMKLGVNHVESLAHNYVVNDPNLDIADRQDAQSEPGVAAYGNDVLVAWNDGRSIPISGASPPTLSNALNFGWSIDGGQTWTTAPNNAMPQTVDGGLWTSDPVIAVDSSNGDFYLCGLYEPNDPLQQNEFTGVAVARGNFVGNSVVWQRPSVAMQVLGPPEITGEFIDKPWIAVDPGTHNVYVTYTHYTASGDSIVFRRSTDRTGSWGPMLALHRTTPGSDATGRVQGSRPAVGPDGEVYVAWKEIGTGAQDFMRVRKSTNFGASFAGEVTAAAFYDDFGSGAPGFNREQGITLPSIAVDRSNGPYRGRVYVSWNESVDYFDSLPTDTSNTTVQFETEPNDTIFTANSFTPGVTLRGSFKSVTDFDYYGFQANAGTTYWFWSNEMSTRYTLRIFSRDGSSRLAFSGDRFNSPPNQGFIAWTCPKTGRYYLRIAIFGSTLTWYRIDTGVDTPGGPSQHARDHRDAFVAWSSNGSTWSAPANVSADEPGRFDDWLPEVAVAADGTVYSSWYGFDDSPDAGDGGWSLTKLARSDDGGTTWRALGPVSDALDDWTNSFSNMIPNQGDYIGLATDATRLYPVWTDTRFYGTPDIWTAPITLSQTQYSIDAVAADPDHVAITWRALGTPATSVDVLRSTGSAPFAYTTIASGLTFDAGGALAYDDSTIAGTTQFRYALRLPDSRIVAERTVRLDAVREVFPRDASPFDAFPNPAVKSLQVKFTLADNTVAKLRLFDLTGRALRELWYQGAGAYDVRLGSGITLKPGLYFVRLAYRGRDWTQRVAVR